MFILSYPLSQVINFSKANSFNNFNCSFQVHPRCQGLRNPNPSALLSYEQAQFRSVDPAEPGVQRDLQFQHDLSFLPMSE